MKYKKIPKNRRVVEPGEDRDPRKEEPGEDRDPQKEELEDLLKEEEPVGLPKEEESGELLLICQNTYTRSTCRKISGKL